MSRPKLLFVTSRFLFPMDEGGKIRTGNILQAMKGEEFELTLASPAPIDHARYTNEISSACDRFIYWTDQGRSQVRRLMALGSRLPVAAACDQSVAGSVVVCKALIERPDIVVVDFPHADALTPRKIDGATVMFTHNVEAEIFELHAKRTWGLWHLIWTNQCKKMAQLEQEVLAHYDTVISVSERDRDILTSRYHLPMVDAVDTGVDLDFFTVCPPEAALDPGLDGGTLVFTATMGWPANVDGIHFLLDHVFPLLLRTRPKIRAVIIGKNPPSILADKIKERGLDVILTGYVADIRPYVAQANVYVIPLFVGSGTRIKAFEAMAMGRPVVSTMLGVDGLGVTDGEDFLRADDAETFAQAVLDLMADASKRMRIAAAARLLVERRFSWFHVARQFEVSCLRTLERMRYISLR